MADLAPAEPLDPEAEWLMVKIVAEKGRGRGKKKDQWVQHGIGRTEEEAIRSVQIPKGYKVSGTPEVVRRDVTPEHYAVFQSPMFDAIREERRKAAKRG